MSQIADDESAVLTKSSKKSSGGAKIGFSYNNDAGTETDSDTDDSDPESKEYLPTVCKFIPFKFSLQKV